MPQGVNKVSSLAKKFDDSNKRHTVSFANSNKTKEKIDLFEKVSSPNAAPTNTSALKDQSNIPSASLNRSFSSSVMIKPHSNNFHRTSSSPNLSSSPKGLSDKRISRNIKSNNTLIKKSIGSFEHMNETVGNSPNTESVSERIARIERKPKKQSSTPFHQDRVKRNFNIRKNATTQETELTERFSKLLQQMENEKLDSPHFKEAMNLFERKSIRFTPSLSESWSNSEEDRLQELLRLLREEEMKRLEMLENMLRKERESLLLSPSTKSIPTPNTSTTSSSPTIVSSPRLNTTTPTTPNPSNINSPTNMKTLHTSTLMDKIKQERNEMIVNNKKMEMEENGLSSNLTVNILVGKPLKERPLPTPGVIVSSPLQSSSGMRIHRMNASSTDPIDLSDFIEQKKKRLTMLPTNADDLFQMW